MVLHPDAKAFVARILSDPTDDVMRAVFADWLQEQGGTGNENWARYIRLRSEAAKAFGTDRDLLREEADNLAPHLKARLTIPAGKFAPHFVTFLDLLPADRYIVTLGDYTFPVEPNATLGETNARAARSLVLTERDGVFALVTDNPLPGLGRVIGQRLNGRTVLIPAYTTDITEALTRTFPPAPPPPPTAEMTVALNRKLARTTAERLVADARHEHASRIEVVAQPSGFDVRFLIDGRPRRKDGLDTAMGELVVKEFFAADLFTRLHVRARPRNTSFGAGAEVDV